MSARLGIGRLLQSLYRYGENWKGMYIYFIFLFDIYIQDIVYKLSYFLDRYHTQ